MSMLANWSNKGAIVGLAIGTKRECSNARPRRACRLANENMRRNQVTFAAVCRRILCAGVGLLWLSNASAACKLDDLQVTPAMISAFLQKPELILGDDAHSTRGTHELSLSVSRYAAAAPASIQALKSIISRSTLRQRTAIGEGLYRAVAFCRASDPLTASRIEIAVNSLENGDITAAYLRAARLPGSPPGTSNSKMVNRFAPANAPARPPGLIEDPSYASPGSLKLSDPFGPPEAWH